MEEATDLHPSCFALLEQVTGTRWLQIKEWIGLSRQMDRYNPLDITCTIRTETPASA